MMPIAIHTRPLTLDAFTLFHSPNPDDQWTAIHCGHGRGVRPSLRSRKTPALLQTAMEELRKLNDDDLVLIISIMHRLNKN